MQNPSLIGRSVVVMRWFLGVISFSTLALGGLVPACMAQTPANPLPDFKIDRLVRFHDLQGAQARRDLLVKAIWPEGLPPTLPAVTPVALDIPELSALDKSLMRSAGQLDVDVGGYDWHSLVFVVEPARQRQPARLAIVHGGHMREGVEHYLASGLSTCANHLLAAGYTVALAQMPSVGWNTDTTLRLANRTITVERRGSAGHSQLFTEVEPELRASTMKFFLEPVVQTINHYRQRVDATDQILMIGLSGGGWTTHMAAAVDDRIDVSLPVAGALPLYARPFSPGSTGDEEQSYERIFGESDTDGDGVTDAATGIASWLEVFALGSVPGSSGRPRQQVQILNLHDNCCFSGLVHESYSAALTSLLDEIEGSRWSVYVDDSHHDHIISQRVIDEVLKGLTK